MKALSVSKVSVRYLLTPKIHRDQPAKTAQDSNTERIGAQENDRLQMTISQNSTKVQCKADRRSRE
eukprot:COSAG03_NODE_312_length_9111_cov_63.231392_7_plen_66_part_00